MRRKCDISSGPRSGGLTTMVAETKASESKAKTIAGEPPNRLPMRNSLLRATPSSLTEGRYCISTPNQPPADELAQQVFAQASFDCTNKADRGQVKICLNTSATRRFDVSGCCEDDRYRNGRRVSDSPDE